METARITAGSLGWFFCFFMALLVALKLWGGRLARSWRNWGSRTKKRNDGGLASAFVMVIIAAVITIFTLAAKQYNDAPVVEKYNVRVIQKVGDDAWSMSDDQGPFLYTACKDFPNDTVIWAGYIARKARWQELGKCKSIRRSDLGFWWLRDKDFNAERIN